MALTIDDIYDKEFALKGGGYDRNDVDQFLDEICDEMANMLEHIEKLEKDLQKAQMEAEAAKAAAEKAAPVVVQREPVARTSETLEGILLSAQRLADEAVENAKAKGKKIGRPHTKKEDIPAAFMKHYAAFMDGKMNVSELARVCGLSRPTVYKYLKMMG